MFGVSYEYLIISGLPVSTIPDIFEKMNITIVNIQPLFCFHTVGIYGYNAGKFFYN